MRIAHLSDIHFGRIAHPAIVEAIVTAVNQADADLVAVSGDLTQRARHREYRAARAMLDAFAAPTLVVPGNHDVYAWWHPLHRLVKPLRRYHRYVSDDLTPCHEQDGLAVLGINSAFGRTVKGGRIARSQRQAVEAFFGDQEAAVFKVLVVHHHLTQIEALGPHDVARNARKTLDVASEVGVDLILCGHLHISHVEPIVVAPRDHRLVIASAGTATSNRGRRSNRDTNFFNLIDVGASQFTITERRFDREARAFVEDGTTRFPRDPS